MPYDNRNVRDLGAHYEVNYSRAKRHVASETLVNMFLREANRNPSARTQFGAILSGCAKVFSRRFIEELLRGVPVGEGGSIIGGEMEGVGLLSLSERDDPIWAVVKGICDFGDGRCNIADTRNEACARSAAFVLAAIANAALT